MDTRFTFGQLLNANSSNGKGGVEERELTLKEEKSKRHAEEKAKKKNKVIITDVKKHIAINVDTIRKPDNKETPLKIRWVEEDTPEHSRLPPTKEEKERYEHLGILDVKKKKEEKYTRSEEYRKYLKEKQNEELTKAGSYLDKMSSTKNNSEKVNSDIITPSTMPEESNPIKKELEKQALSAEDLELQQAVYEEVKMWREILEKEEREVTAGNDENKKTQFQIKMQTFESNPYEWTQNALENKLHALERDFKDPENKKYQKEITNKLNEVDARLNNLISSYEKRIPLNLERNDRTKDIRPDEGIVFDSKDVLKILNVYLKTDAINYTVGNAFQRGPAQYIVLKTNSGEEKEINIRKLDSILNEAQEREEKIYFKTKERLEKFEKMKVGDILQVSRGRRKEDVTTYKILEMTGKEVRYKNLNKKVENTVPLSDLKDLLFKPNIKFFIEDDKKLGYRGSDSAEALYNEYLAYKNTNGSEPVSNTEKIETTDEEETQFLEIFKRMNENQLVIDELKKKLERLKEEEALLDTAASNEEEKENTYGNGDIVYNTDNNPIGVIKFDIGMDKVSLINIENGMTITDKSYAEFIKKSDADIPEFFVNKE